ncbi:MAG: SNF2-related protein [Desulfurococcales archaeon]|nr:SNF2-related protein [Desulfurococcales archaeon]
MASASRLALELVDALKYNPYANLYLSLNGQYIKVDGYKNYIHQIDLYTDYLAHPQTRLLIADEIGLGKTVEALRFIKFASYALGAKHFLVITPASLVVQWIEGDGEELGIPMKRIDKTTINELLEEYQLIGSLRPGVYIGSMDTLKYGSEENMAPYYDLISSIKWDVVIVDEAHRLAGGNVRYDRLGKVFEKADHVLLLTATPTRGDPLDLLQRLKLIDPSIIVDRRTATLIGLAVSEESRKALRALRRAYIRRRTKRLLRKLGEAVPLIPPANFLVAQIDISRQEERLFEDIYFVTARLLKALGAGPEAGLLRALVVKRALSSPLGFIRTLRNILGSEKRIEKIDRLPEYEFDEPEEDLDEITRKGFAKLVQGLPSDVKNDILRIVEEAKSLEEEGDSSVKALVGFLELISSGEPLISEDKDTIWPNMLVFTEYVDTLEYIRSIVKRELTVSKRRLLDDTLKRRFLEKYAGGKRYERLRAQALSSFDLYQAPQKGLLAVFYLSSQNARIIPLVARIVTTTRGKDRISTVIITTDVAAEGLNLQGANILINYEIPWSMVKREQRIGRVWRIGQQKTVYVIDFLRKTWLEIMIYERLLQKLFYLSASTGEQPQTGPSGIMFVKLKEREPGIHGFVKPKEYQESRILVEVSRIMEDPKLLQNREEFKRRIDEFARTLQQKISKYKALSRLMEETHKNVGKQYLQDSLKLYGAKNHEEAENAILILHKAILGRPANDISTALVNLQHLRGQENEDTTPYIGLVSSEIMEEEIAELYISEIKRQDKTIYKSPILVFYSLKNGRHRLQKQYTGIKAVEKLAELLQYSTPIDIEHGFIIANIDKGLADPLDLNNIIRELQDTIIRRYKNWNKALNSLAEMKIRDGSSSDSVKFKGSIQRQPLAIFYKITGGQGEVEIDESLKREIQCRAENYVKQLFEDKGFYTDTPSCIREGRGEPRRPYDIEATPRQMIHTGEPYYYVEVKGHSGLSFVAELTNREYEYAEQHKDRYIVCVVAHALSKNPVVVCKPYYQWNKLVEKKIVEERIVLSL